MIRENYGVESTLLFCNNVWDSSYYRSTGKMYEMQTDGAG